MTEHSSVWLATAEAPTYPPLSADQRVDVAVVGGGITGLTTALLLARAGRRVAVLDAHGLGTGTTGHTTGKVTSQHGLVYADMVSQLGERKARLYAEANQAGVEQVAALVADTDADCAYTRAPAYVYTHEADYAAQIEREADVAARLGLPAHQADPGELPFPVVAAVRFDDQAHFHAVRYVNALAAAIVAAGGVVHPHTRALGVDERGDHVVVRTGAGEVRAEHAVVATLLPFVDTGGFFAKARASRAYGLAARISDPERVGMFITAEQPTRSVRPWRHESGTGVIVVGEEHETGAEVDTGRHYDALEQWARATFAVESIDYRWSAQDYRTVDGAPYVGRSPRRQRTWVATGFKKWGLSNGTAAAMVLADQVQGRESPWAEVFDASRIGDRRAVGRLVTDNAKVGAHLVGDWLARSAARPLDDLAPGEGGVVRSGGAGGARGGGGKVFGAYRDEQGTVHGVSLTCTHLKCTVRWNAAETSWDCPCHGSRFGYDGTVLNGPAVEDLPRVDP